MRFFESKPDIAKMRAKRDVPGLSKVLDHEDPSFRCAAAEALATSVATHQSQR